MVFGYLFCINFSQGQILTKCKFDTFCGTFFNETKLFHITIHCLELSFLESTNQEGNEKKSRNMGRISQGKEIRNKQERKNPQQVNNERKQRQNQKKETSERTRIEENKGKKNESKIEKKDDTNLKEKNVNKKVVGNKNGLKTFRRNETLYKESTERRETCSGEKQPEKDGREVGKGKSNERKAKLLKKEKGRRNATEEEGKANISGERETRVQRVFSGFGNKK